MTSTQTQSERATQIPSAAKVDMKLEVVVLPVSDVDRAKSFYGGLGWRLDADFTSEDFRVVQLTPPGSQCSIHFGKGVTKAVPGSVQSLYLVVSDLEAARAELIGRGVDVSEALGSGGHACRAPTPKIAPTARTPRSAIRTATAGCCRRSRRAFPDACDRARPAGGFIMDVATLTELLRDAEKRHGQYEPTAPKHHWSGWYAAYIIARERGRSPDEAAKDAALHMERTRDRVQG